LHLFVSSVRLLRFCYLFHLVQEGKSQGWQGRLAPAGVELQSTV
jgi:hypothetical protein